MATDDLTAVSDAALVVAIGRWRQDALAEAYRRHGGAVFGLARRVIANEEAAKDIVQEIFLKAFEAQIAALKTEQDVLKFAFALEQIAAQTYQGVGMKLSTPMLRQTAMTVGGVGARHMAILAHFITPPMTVPAVGFQPTDKAIDASFHSTAAPFQVWPRR